MLTLCYYIISLTSKISYLAIKFYVSTCTDDNTIYYFEMHMCLAFNPTAIPNNNSEKMAKLICNNISLWHDQKFVFSFSLTPNKTFLKYILISPPHLINNIVILSLGNLSPQCLYTGTNKSNPKIYMMSQIRT